MSDRPVVLELVQRVDEIVEDDEYLSPELLNDLREMFRGRVENVADEGTKLVPGQLLEVLELSVSEFEPYENFEAFFQRYGVDLQPFFAWVKRTSQGEPLYMKKSRQLMQITFMLLCHRCGVDVSSFQSFAIQRPFLVDGSLHRYAEKMADKIFLSIRTRGR